MPLLLSITRLLFALLMVSYAATDSVQAASTPTIAKPGCSDRCGNVRIPYPFGMDTSDCYRNSSFKITCNHSNGTQTAFLDSWDHRRYQVLEIMLDFVRIRVPAICEFPNTLPSEPFLRGTPFTISDTRNKLVIIGCNIYGYIKPFLDTVNEFGDPQPGCATGCKDFYGGYSWCNTTIPNGLKGIKIEHQLVARAGDLNDSCIRGFLVDEEFPWLDEGSHYNDFSVPVILDWAIVDFTTCYEACGRNTDCLPSHNGPGYSCKCSKGYEGNPYLLHGCQDVERRLRIAVSVSSGIGVSIVILVLLGLGYWLPKRSGRKQMKLKKSHFTRNGGLLLKQKIASNDGKVEKAAKIFVTEELEKATDNFNPSRIIGKGGFGTVYKGMLSDGEIVAIKKSTLVDENQIDQFINEVVILSQINHRHIVRLLGCCLETEVPLLVYEFVANGTLAYHLHLEEGNYESTRSWKDRVRIASEVAGALAYLHADAVMPIFHRDIKSTNILLDENLQAKVSDFGISRSIPIDQTHLTTLVQGTFGYLDPEYFRSGQFTDKSDVYSFGIVLVELLTGERAISQIRQEEEKGLALYFINSMKEDRLSETLDARLLNEGEIDDVLVVAKLAKRCLKYIGKKRPTMKEVSLTLGGLHDKLSRVIP